jgi:mannosylglycerate hydrolase
VYEPAKDTPQATAFLQWLLLRLSAWHDYLHRERDPECEGLVYTRHPWESGMDNSPMWDQIMQRLQLRPEQVPAMSAPIPTTWPPKSGA